MTSQDQTGIAQPSVARYSLMFAVVHFPLAIAFGLLVTAISGESAGGLGVVVIVGAAEFVGWRFVRRNHRHFTAQERWLLIGYCAIYMALFEALALWGSDIKMASFSGTAWLGVAALGIGLDILLLWIAFRFVVGKRMQKAIDKLTARAA